MSEDSGAVVRVVNGQLVLDDPVALGLIRAIEKHNCFITAQLNLERIIYFRRRIDERGDDPVATAIVVVNVDDSHGGIIADMLMPGTNWQEFRDRGEVPFARGLVGREFIQHALECFDTEAASNLKSVEGTAIVIVDHGVAEIFTLAD